MDIGVHLPQLGRGLTATELGLGQLDRQGLGAEGLANPAAWPLQNPSRGA